MAKKQNEVRLPGRKDVEKLLYSLNSVRTAEEAGLDAKRKAADEKLEEFHKVNSEYRRLLKEQEEASAAYYRTHNAAKNKRDQERRKLWNQLRLKGITQDLLNKIERMLEKYPDEEIRSW